MEQYNPNIEVLNEMLSTAGITAHRCYANAKASEFYVEITFTQEDGFAWKTVVPYIYRRTHLNLSSDAEVANYLKEIKPYFSQSAMRKWRKREWAKWQADRNKVKDPAKLVTIEFFKVLLSFRQELDFPKNSNPQRRLQDIKDRGYTVCIYPVGNNQWGKVLLPIPLHKETGYEVFTPQFKSRVIRLFNGINAYEARETAKRSLIPDHKFSEVRWDENTKADNPMTMTDEEIIAKFQLLDNQRNQQKREVCRICVQTGKRGSLFGIDYFPAGGENWDEAIPTYGKEAEKGCIGCPWYDIEAWRKAINKKLNNEE